MFVKEKVVVWMGEFECLEVRRWLFGREAVGGWKGEFECLEVRMWVFECETVEFGREKVGVKKLRRRVFGRKNVSVSI